MPENAKKPQIRFKGFTDAWEQRKLGEVFNYEQPQDYIVKTTKYDDKYKIPVLTAGQSFILGYTDENFGIKKADKVNPVVIFDDFTTSSHYVDFSFKIKSSAMKILTLADEKTDIYSAFIVLQNIKYIPISHERHWISTFSNFKVKIPQLQEEQTKLGKFFHSIDHLITLHQRKLDKLKNIKKSMLEKMFPKNGSNVPEIRFKGFTDAWEQRKLGDLGTVSMNKRIFKEQTSENGEIPFYKIGTFGGKADAYISRELFEEYKTKYPYPQKGDILISASGSIGRTVEFTGKDEYFQDSNIVWLNHHNRINNSFLKYFYLIVNWYGVEGSTIKRLYNDNILNTNINLPISIEQEKIGNFFNRIDNLITLHQRKLEKLKNIKKACLEKMFV